MSAKRFRIAFSFAGEKRDFVAQVAAILAKRFTKEAILYDKYHEAEFARRNLGIYLPELYHEQSDLVVVVVCPDYDVKQWTGLEWTAIHDLLSKRKDDEVMLCRFDHAIVKGLYSTAPGSSNSTTKRRSKPPRSSSNASPGTKASPKIITRPALREAASASALPSRTTSPASSPSSAAKRN
ncbi:MAG: hypothetical protein ACREWE_12015 [Gammaproteobacteria bacterium]